MSQPLIRRDRVFDFMTPKVVEGLDLRKGTVLYMEDVSVSFDGFQAINDLNFYVDAGELRCVIGPNGAGKTTMMDIITIMEEGFFSSITISQLALPFWVKSSASDITQQKLNSEKVNTVFFFELDLM